MEVAATDQPRPPASIKAVLVQAINGTAKVLLLRNERNEWELPGGRPELGETPEACLVREVCEETGLAIKVGPCIHQGTLLIFPPHVCRAASVAIYSYGCRLEKPKNSHLPVTVSSEHTNAGWIPVADISVLNDLPEVYKAAVAAWERWLVVGQ